MKTNFCMKRWEIALIAGLIFAIIAGVRISGEQASLAGKLVRLHVVANSDNAEDQALKLKVRDRVLDESAGILNGVSGSQEAEDALRDGLFNIERAARDEVLKNGYDYEVRAELSPMHFDTRRYDGFSLPAGDYDALKISIGSGRGKNWWCVVFPPLCYSAAVGEVSQSAASAGLSGDEIGLITEDGGEYVIKFKSMELIGDFINTIKEHW